jgi:tRNA (adenine37-N6)-methyltransferase
LPKPKKRPVDSPVPETEPWQAIGTIHSPFRHASGTPVQPFAARTHLGGWDPVAEALPESPFVQESGGRGTLEIQPQWLDALDDLEGFSRIWIFFWCHRGARALPRVKPYRDTVERGLFATRAPARPNPIGLSCVRLLGVRGRFIHVAELDALDGSPLLDIKPYVPAYDSFPDVRIGWLQSPTAKPGAMHADGRFEDPSAGG